MPPVQGGGPSQRRRFDLCVGKTSSARGNVGRLHKAERYARKQTAAPLRISSGEGAHLDAAIIVLVVTFYSGNIRRECFGAGWRIVCV